MELPWNEYWGYPKSLNVPPADGSDPFTALPKGVLEMIYELAFEPTYYPRRVPQGPPCRALKEIHRRHRFRRVCLRQPEQVWDLLETVEADESLGELVRDLVSELYGDSTTEESPEEAEMIEGILQQTAEALRRLLRRLPRLRTIDVRGEDVYLESVLASVTVLPDLVKLTVFADFWRSDFCDPTTWVALSHSPAFRKLLVNTFATESEPSPVEFHQPVVPPFISQLTTLELSGPLVASPHLSYFLGATTAALTSLSLSTNWPTRASDPLFSAFLNHIPHPSSLRVLSLKGDGAEHGHVVNDTAFPPALERFTALQSLTLSGNNFFSSTTLYTTLASLPLHVLALDCSKTVTLPGLVYLLHSSRTLRILRPGLPSFNQWFIYSKLLSSPTLYATLASLPLHVLALNCSKAVTLPGLVYLLHSFRTLRILRPGLPSFNQWFIYSKLLRLAPGASSSAPDKDLHRLAFPNYRLAAHQNWAVEQLFELIAVGKEVDVRLEDGAVEQLQQEGFYEGRIEWVREKLRAEEEEKKKKREAQGEGAGNA
ncbi:hypothetical protein JCM6882_008092 [Rhodosporidiobolus microsporus]